MGEIRERFRVGFLCRQCEKYGIFSSLPQTIGICEILFLKRTGSPGKDRFSFGVLRLLFFVLRFFANPADEKQESGHADA